jgi:ADP-heptose:LPS heptosyltransferase
LLTTYPHGKCVLLGTKAERPLCAKIASALPAAAVFNLAGQTNLLGLERELLRTQFVIASDSGGMHLANSLGIPTLGLFAHTSPARSGPFFNAPSCALQGPKKCMSSLEPPTVYRALIQWLAKINHAGVASKSTPNPPASGSVSL